MSDAAPPPDPLTRLARESGRLLAELGVAAEDERWIRLHAESLAGLVAASPRETRGRRLLARLYRRAFRAARTAR